MTLNGYPYMCIAQNTFPWGHELHLFSRGSVLIIIVCRFGCWMPRFFQEINTMLNLIYSKISVPSIGLGAIRYLKIYLVSFPYRCYMYITNWLRFPAPIYFRRSCSWMIDVCHMWLSDCDSGDLKMFNLIWILQCATGNTCKKHMFLIHNINKDILYCFTGIAASVQSDTCN